MFFHNEIRTHFGASIHTFRSDNAPEYLSQPFQSYLQTYGILHETSCAYTPQQKGVYERKHRHLLEVARCLLLKT